MEKVKNERGETQRYILGSPNASNFRGPGQESQERKDGKMRNRTPHTLLIGIDV